jgi:hypothetical protein
VTVHDPSNIGKFARERFSSALMSDTKWRKLFAAIANPELGVRRMLVKFIDVDEPRQMNFPPSLKLPHAYMDTIEFGPVELRAIEWLELPIDAEPVMRPLRQFPLERVEGGTRIVGYRR